MKEENKRADRIVNTAKTESSGSVSETRGTGHIFQSNHTLGKYESKVIPCMSCSYYTYYGCTRTDSCRLLSAWQEANDQNAG